MSVHPCLPGMPAERVQDSWFTPDDLFRELEALYGPFDLDVVASAENAKCARFYTAADDALTQPWPGRVWCNPPYRDLLDWVRKAREETLSGRCTRAVLLLPAHTSTTWFHDYALPFARLHWVRRKRRFGNAQWNAMMPSVAVIFDAEALP